MAVLPCELLKFRPKFFAAVTMLRVVIDNFIVWLISLLFVLQTSDGSRPYIGHRFRLEVLVLHFLWSGALSYPVLDGFGRYLRGGLDWIGPLVCIC